MKNELLPLALLLIALHFVGGCLGAWLAGLMLRRSGKSLSGRATFLCGMLGGLIGMGAVLVALPVTFGLVASPVLGFLVARVWGKKNQ